MQIYEFNINNMKKLIKKWLGIDELKERVDYNEALAKSNKQEIEHSWESLSLANHWLRELSIEFDDITIDFGKGFVIPPQDNAEDTWGSKSHVEKVNWIANEIKQLTHLVLELEGGKLDTAIWTDYMHEVKMFAYKHLSEANFWLTLELQRINENYEKGS